MQDHKKLKILLLGPCGIGKSVLANVLSESMDIETSSDARPTQGVRIVEFELSDLNLNNRQVKAEIELWDCSGDHRFESCWPAFRANAQGVILCCPSTNSMATQRELELLYNYFVTQRQLSPKQCLVFYIANDQQADIKNLKLSSIFSKVSQVMVNTSTGLNRLKIDFSNFISSVMASIKNNDSMLFE